MAVRADIRQRAQETVRALAADYGDATCALRHDSPLQLLVATILSAQCTDERVNMVTPGLFARWPTAADFARAPLPELERAIQSTGFFRNKAKNIQGCCRALVEEHGGEVPRDLESLVKLPGVGRKTANVVLGTAFGIPSGVVVDTHVTRLTRRLGLTKQTDPVKIEREMIEIVPREEWINFSHRLIHHGRRICMARKPNCPACRMRDFCPQIGVADKTKQRPGKGPKSAKRSQPRPAGSAAARKGAKKRATPRTTVAGARTKKLAATGRRTKTA